MSGAVAERLLRLAGGLVVVALALSFAIHVVTTLLPRLIGIAVVIGLVVLSVAIVRYRRTRW